MLLHFYWVIVLYCTVILGTLVNRRQTAQLIAHRFLVFLGIDMATMHISDAHKNINAKTGE